MAMSFFTSYAVAVAGLISCGTKWRSSMGEKRHFPGIPDNLQTRVYAIVQRERESAMETLMGRPLPADVNAESAFLGRLFTMTQAEKHYLDRAMDLGDSAMFYDDRHATVFEAIAEAYHAQEEISIITVTRALRRMGRIDEVGGVGFLGDLMGLATGSIEEINALYYLKELAMRRKAIEEMHRILQRAYREEYDTFDVIEQGAQALTDIVNEVTRSTAIDNATLMQRAITATEEAANSGDEMVGLPSGLTELDKITLGFPPGQMVIVAARPAMGKTAFALTLAHNMAIEQGTPAAFFSLEMSATQLGQRMISLRSRVFLTKIMTGRMGDQDWPQFHRASRDIGNQVAHVDGKPTRNPAMWVDDGGNKTAVELRSSIRQLRRQHGVQVVFVDYLQLVAGDRRAGGQQGYGNKHSQVDHISKTLTAVAKEENISIVALSQLSRAVEARGGDKKPQLSDLRESGSIEEDAYQVMFLYRPEYYGFPEDADGHSTDGVAHVIVAKNRNGPVGEAKLGYDKQCTRFHNGDLAMDDGAQSNADGGGNSDWQIKPPDSDNGMDEAPF